MDPRPRGQTFEEQQRRFNASPLWSQLGLTLEEARPGYARLALVRTPMVPSGIGGSVHGGILAALVDIAMLEATIPALEPNEQPGGTADLNITYMRPAMGPRITIEATMLRKGRTLAVTEVEIKDDAGKLCAKGRTLYVVRQVGER